MATIKPEDTLDIDRFLDLRAYSPSREPSVPRGKAIAAPEIRAPNVNINTFAPLQQGSQPFAGPSHQYDLHKQHIPLPPGALASSLAATQRPSFAYNGFSQGFGTSSNTGLYDMSSADEFFDFGAASGHNPSFSGSADMDMDFDSPVDGAFSNGSDYVDPNAIGGQEDDSPTPTRAEIVRAYPGMHAHQAQQAALAKQQQQQEIQRQQQERAAQRPQNTSSHKPSASRSSAQRAPMDPAVEERISRLLSQMRNNSADGDDDSAHSPPPSLSKAKKAEEDMDDDERLLASEEGKKLSSKERRQLRNKVSARAFRSRRKEYIGQLEGEVAVKANEAENLRVECEALRAENSRLTDLSRLLLSSPAFSTFLNDLTANGLPPSIGQTLQVEPTHSQLNQESPSNRQQYQLQQQNNAQGGMVTIPESQMQFPAMDSTNNNWNVGTDFNFNTQIFAVTELPQGPAVDTINTSVLSGKSEEPLMPASSFEEKTESIPSIEVPPSVKLDEPTFEGRDDVELDESDPAFALFTSAPSPASPSCAAPTEPVYQLFGSIDFGKAIERFDIVVENERGQDNPDGIVSAATMARFERYCASLDASLERLEGFIV